jgi:hypothetical protein
MNLKSHSIASLPLAAAAYAASDSAGYSILAALVSIFIDLDHIPEYLAWRRARSSIDDFFTSNRHHSTPTVIYPMHGWESILFLGLLAAWLLGPAWALAICVGWAYHLVLDQITNPVGGRFYFVSYRAAKGFIRAKMVGPQGIMCTMRPLRPGSYEVPE